MLLVSDDAVPHRDACKAGRGSEELKYDLIDHVRAGQDACETYIGVTQIALCRENRRVMHIYWLWRSLSH